MAIPDLGDDRLLLLVEIYAEAARELQRDFEKLAFSAGSLKHAIYQRIMRTLAGLRETTVKWGDTNLIQFMQEADAKAISRLKSVANTSIVVVDEVAANAMVSAMLADFDKALGSIANLAARVLRNTQLETALELATRRETAIGILQAQGPKEVSRRIKDVLTPAFKDGIVSILGKNGRTFHYSLDYYAALVAHQNMRQAATVATYDRARASGYDLVRVSPNPSTIGDYCDAYKGRVFSISGRSDTFPWIGDTPNGGPPFHPWCRHSIAIFIPDFYTEAELTELGDVDEKFLLNPGETSHKRILKDWMSEAEDG